ncbi:polysaccharide lyase beta-sandwich domain-containing protein [Streptomyces chengbuensis]|uniref:polysaccharide lyase beta-sandwich domain-containing protein n=1 Tax=Streptomyces TaxID=1883 RepID=UPI0025B455D7|nr:polysaccharide lyase beta-sandwich domain-containing protein [Streptomyces sp. HUAS CB01]WJY55053.1 polysaccharide lyase beta-sandwich domain-containing protein [Streptomyces sp. HUAS CB01]
MWSNDRFGALYASAPPTGVTFWSAGTVGPVTASGPVSVQIRERRDGTAVVSGADPTRTVRGLTLTRRRRVTAVLSTAPAVTSTGTGAVFTAAFGDLGGSHGATHTLNVRTA